MLKFNAVESLLKRIHISVAYFTVKNVSTRGKSDPNGRGKSSSVFRLAPVSQLDTVPSYLAELTERVVCLGFVENQWDSPWC